MRCTCTVHTQLQKENLCFMSGTTLWPWSSSRLKHNCKILILISIFLCFRPLDVTEHFQKCFCWLKITHFKITSSDKKRKSIQSKLFWLTLYNYLRFGVCLQTSEILVIALLSSTRCCTVLCTAGTMVKFLDVQSNFSLAQIQPPGQSWSK